MHSVQETKHTNHNGSQLYVAELNQYYKPWKFISLYFRQNTSHQTGTLIIPEFMRAVTRHHTQLLQLSGTRHHLHSTITPKYLKPHQHPDLLLFRNQTIQTIIVYKVMLQHLIYRKDHQHRPVADREQLWFTKLTTICYSLLSQVLPNPANTNHNGS